MRAPLPVTALVLAATLALPARAADPVTDALQTAYAPYRAALFRTNGKSQPDAQVAIAQTRQAWKSVREQFGAGAPAPYDRDTEFGATLANVAKIYDKAAGEIDAGKLPEAHETLEEARDVLAALRQRNGVIVFSDHMNAYHAEMERLLVEGPTMIAVPQGLQKLTAQAGVLEYLSRQLRIQAPAPLRQNPEFDTLLKDVETSVRAVRDAAYAQDAAALQSAMGKVKPPYSRLFLKFG